VASLVSEAVKDFLAGPPGWVVWIIGVLTLMTVLTIPQVIWGRPHLSITVSGGGNVRDLAFGLRNPPHENRIMRWLNVQRPDLHIAGIILIRQSEPEAKVRRGLTLMKRYGPLQVGTGGNVAIGSVDHIPLPVGDRTIPIRLVHFAPDSPPYFLGPGGSLGPEAEPGNYEAHIEVSYSGHAQAVMRRFRIRTDGGADWLPD